MYSRLAYLALKPEVTENTALLPTVFMPITALDVVTQWSNTPSVPILGVRNNRINPVRNAIDAPTGSLTVQVEPKTFGYLLKAVFGSVTTGRYFPISSVSGTFTVGETVTGGTSSATATVLAVSKEADYLIMGSPTGTFTAAGEALTGGSSGATATLGVNAATVYGHEFKAPQTSLPTYTVEVGYETEAYRMTGVRFPAFNSVTSEDNIITAELALMARAEFKHARVTATLSSGAGSKVILVDQTQGLATSDTIKIYRPGTGFLDFSAASTKTHTIGSISAGVSVTVTNLETSLAVGDLLMLAPQTPSYTVSKEMSWIGGSVARIGSTISAAIAASASTLSLEMFDIAIVNEMESRHAANAQSIAGLFPTANHLKAFTGNGTLRRAYSDMTLMDRMRNLTQTALQVRHTSDQIASTGVYETLDWRLPYVVFGPFHPPLAEDALLDEEVPFDLFRESTAGYSAKALLVNAVTTYA